MRAIVDRSLRYTSDRARLGAPADRTADLAARAAFFTVADAMKLAIPLGELANRGALPARRPLRVIDLGAGCGAMALGLLASLPATAIEYTGIDRDSAALGIAAAAIRAFATSTGAAVTVTTRTGDAVKAPLGEADLVVMGTLLNELAPGEAVAVVARALAAIGDDGAVIAIEPALRETSRALHEVRDAVIRGGLGHVFAPCTRRGAPCPALADPDDWCHEDRALQLPPRTAELARLTHLRDGGMKFSYLVLRRQPLRLVDLPSHRPAAVLRGPSAPGLVDEAEAWRVVSAPRPAKGKLELIGCSDRGRITLRLLRRHRSAANREVERADRGDVLVVEGGPAPDDAAERIELGEATGVQRREPARR